MKYCKLLFATAFFVCSIASFAQTKREKAIQEINAAEKAFANMALEKGIQEAFTFYAAEDAVIQRGGDSLIRGKKGIGNFYSKEQFKRAVVKWSPDYTDAAESGELGYTVGGYTWQFKDADGKVEESKGIFHTVWKRQKDGQWKFVWD